MRDLRACCGRPSAGRSNSRPATNALSDGAPAAERSSAAQQILSSELARSTDAAELQLTRPFGGSIADKPESIHDTSCRASGAGTAVTPRGSPAGRQRAGNRSAVSVSAPAAIRGAMDRTRGGADARPWRAAPADRRGGRFVEALNLRDARPLDVSARDAFLREVASALASCPAIGDGVAHRVVAEIQRRHFLPPEFGDGKARRSGGIWLKSSPYSQERHGSHPFRSRGGKVSDALARRKGA